MTLRAYGASEQGCLEMVGDDAGGDGVNGLGLLIPHLVLWVLLKRNNTP